MIEFNFRRRRFHPLSILPLLFFLFVLRMHSGQVTEYKIGPQDQLQISVMGVAEINQLLIRVTEEGKISLPLVGEVQVEGLTGTEVERKLARLFEEQNFLRNPQVTVYIHDFVSKIVTIYGAVEKPGSYPIIGQQRIINIISKAGGLTAEAGDEIIIIREIPGGGSLSIKIPISALFEQGDTSYNKLLEPNDYISVPVDRIVTIYVMGQVNKPGAHLVKKSKMPYLTEAIAIAEGFAPRADKKNVVIKWRDENGKEHQRTVNVKKIINGQMEDIPLKENDFVFVKETWW
ncbi:MAG: polysaccharide export protein [Acidobacteria bacterium]|nr:polysaccharide export protein [Acidobacteriota bacterium]MBU4494651.1 polysaccharide export protein [Acidobacteriota bacterium]